MLPKIASALARVLDPIKPIARPGQSISLSKSAEGGEGGHGPLGYQSPEEQKGEGAEAPGSSVPESLEAPPMAAEHSEKRASALPLQPGLTQVILELNGNRNERAAGSAVQSYETGAKEQKKNARLPKGSMLDKKVG